MSFPKVSLNRSEIASAGRWASFGPVGSALGRGLAGCTAFARFPARESITFDHCVKLNKIKVERKQTTHLLELK
jgi:hypothetical protein